MKVRKRISINFSRPFPAFLTAVFLISLLLAACAAEESPTLEAMIPVRTVEIPSATATLSPAPTQTPLPTGTPAPTDTPAPTNTPQPTPQIYMVQAGDTLWRIAEAFETTTGAIQRANELVDGGAIVAGQELVIPPTTSASEVTPQETGEASADRGVLPNHILCPAADEIEAQGGVVTGRSAICGIPIVSRELGDGTTPLVIVGGIHGGYEWNTILLAYQLLDYLEQNQELIPPALSVHLIPNANPDGLYAVTQKIGRFTPADVARDTVPGRMNGNGVDLNRNWDCDWTPEAWWGYEAVSSGSAPFSEAETQALRDFFLDIEPAVVLFLHSAATGVYPAGCGGTDPRSRELGVVYSSASGYRFYDQFDRYHVTGDASDWLASQGIPAITVELSNHSDLDFNSNLQGLIALLNHLSQS